MGYLKLKLITGILIGSLSLPFSHYAYSQLDKWQNVENKIYQISKENRRYLAKLVINRNKKATAWYITDGRNFPIGDQEEERELYRDLALTAQVVSIQNLINSIEETNNNFGKITMQRALTYDLPNFIVKKGSELEGMLVKGFYGSKSNVSNLIKSATEETQKEFIKENVKNLLKDIIEDYFEELYKDNKEINNPIELASILKEKFQKTIYGQMLEARKNLNKAIEIAKNHGGYWDYEEAREFYDSFKEGYIKGFACASLWANTMEDAKWENIAKNISNNFIKGLTGYSLEEILMNTEFGSEVARSLFKDKNMKRAIDETEKTMVEWMTRFKAIENFWDLDNNSSYASIFLERYDKRINNERIGNKNVKNSNKDITILNENKKLEEPKIDSVITELNKIYEIDLNGDGTKEKIYLSEITEGLSGIEELMAMDPFDTGKIYLHINDYKIKVPRRQLLITKKDNEYFIKLEILVKEAGSGGRKIRYVNETYYRWNGKELEEAIVFVHKPKN